MFKKFLVGLGIILIFMILTGCSSTDQKKVPLMVLIEEKLIPGRELTEAKLEQSKQVKVLQGYWNLQTGKFFLEEKPLFKVTDRSGDDLLRKVIWDGGKRIGLFDVPRDVRPDFKIEKITPPSKALWGVAQVLSDGGDTLIAYSLWKKPEKKGEIRVETYEDCTGHRRVLSTSLPSDTDIFGPLLIWGNQENFSVLAACEAHSAPKELPGVLLLANVQGERVQWQEGAVRESLFAGAGVSLVKQGAKVYYGGGRVHVLGLTGKSLAVKEYDPANNLIRRVEDKVLRATDTGVQTTLGVFNDILLVTVPSINESWTWAIQNDRCIGTLYISNKEQKIKVYQGNKLVDEMALPAGFSGFRFPNGGCGTW
ncbi:hypothetical protein Desku_3076 [Desulfofundulus kuznetsovii DSM 6115]|uniref:Lipoprotein n=1 Tax=Desulfofundulus kuznetsovii (strain DSM 6115 / VKM B-1805 / 17) TaxID=760568 RepID=A0AAU8PQ97_DESK7|nr:hypothetical protein Desku_3076 [Desulfofundulus kuznetsovii DSM 6115]